MFEVKAKWARDLVLGLTFFVASQNRREVARDSPFAVFLDSVIPSPLVWVYRTVEEND